MGHTTSVFSDHAVAIAHRVQNLNEDIPPSPDSL